MRKWLGVVLIICFVLMTNGSAFAVGLENDFINTIELIDEPYTYTVLPGTDAWNKMSLFERRAACCVSRETAMRMTTNALLETVLNYPFLTDIHAFDSLQYGIEVVSEDFPALEVLLSRKDIQLSIERVQETAVVKATDTKSVLRNLHCNIFSKMANVYSN